MKRLKLLIVVVGIVLLLVVTSSALLSKLSVYDIKSFFYTPFSKYFDNGSDLEDGDENQNDSLDLMEVDKETLSPLTISLIDNKVALDEVKVKVNQPIIWKNDQKNTKSQIYGVREAIDIRSPLLNSGDSFKWVFNKSGRYSYVDVIVLGRSGVVIVED